MPTDAASPRWSENSCAEHHALQLQREAWPISAHAHWHSTHDYAPRVLHFSAFHYDSIVYVTGEVCKDLLRLSSEEIHVLDDL